MAVLFKVISMSGSYTRVKKEVVITNLISYKGTAHD